MQSQTEQLARKRRSLSLPGHNLRTHGEPSWADRLGDALLIPGIPEQIPPQDRQVVEAALGPHLFHSYAGRTHPLLVRLLCQDMQPGESLLDPFVGSGTVLVEGVRIGLKTVGCDISPLSIRLSRLKATPMPEPMQKALLLRAQSVCDASLARVKKRLSPPRNYDDPQFYAPHVYLELCGLRQEIASVCADDAPLGEALLLIFSSIVVKASRQRSESSQDLVERQIGKGQVSRWFLRKAEEFVRLQSAFWQKGQKTIPPLLIEGDARSELLAQTEQKLARGSVQRVITSPPYLGTYDYLHHHLRRYAWLGIDPAPIERDEMAARRQALPLRKRIERHEADTWNWLSAIERLLQTGGLCFVLVGDSVVDETLLDGAQPIHRAAESTRLRVMAEASVERPHAVRTVHPLPPRREHLILLQRNG